MSFDHGKNRIKNFCHGFKYNRKKDSRNENLEDDNIDYMSIDNKPGKDSAVKSGAECMFIEKYPDVVTVYTIGDFSKELCGGPHVKNTNELGKFKIKKEEASSAGVRRIKAVLE